MTAPGTLLWMESGVKSTCCGEPFADVVPSTERWTMTIFDKEPFAPILVSQSDVEQMWRTLMQPLGWRRRALWFCLVAPDDRPLPRICEVPDLPDEIDLDAQAAAAALWRDLLADLA